MKKSKYPKSEWHDSDFASFWQHYAKVQEWVRIESECRQNALDDWEWRRAEKQCISLLSTVAAHLGSELDTTVGESAAISTDDGGADANANGVPTIGMECDQVEEQQKQTQTERGAAPINELEASAVYLASATPTKRKKLHKKPKQQRHEQKWAGQKRTEAEWEDNESSTDEQMKAFRQTTLEHRKQWEQKKREEQQKAKQRQEAHRNGVNNDDDEDEEYFDASKMSFKATHQQRQQHQQQNAAAKNPLIGTGGWAAAASVGIAENASVVSVGGGSSGVDDLAMRARDYRRRGLYGAAGLAQLDTLEGAVRAHFDAEFAKHTPDTWPNIPLRF